MVFLVFGLRQEGCEHLQMDFYCTFFPQIVLERLQLLEAAVINMWIAYFHSVNLPEKKI